MYDDDAKVEALIKQLAAQGEQRRKSVAASKAFLVKIGLLTPSGRPTPRYRDLARKRPAAKRRAIRQVGERIKLAPHRFGRIIDA